MHQEQSLHAALLTMDATYDLIGLARRSASFRSLETLLENSSISKEIGLTELQSREIKEVFARARESIEQQKTLLKGRGGRGTRLPGYESLNHAKSSLTAQAVNEAIRLLTASQRQRLGEILIQAMGILAVTHPAVATRARIDPSRLYKMKKVIDETRLKIRLLNGPMERLTDHTLVGSDGVTNYYINEYRVLQLRGNPSREQIMLECEARIRKLIPLNQRPKLEKLGGRPFDFSSVESPPQPPPRRSTGIGGRNGNVPRPPGSISAPRNSDGVVK